MSSLNVFVVDDDDIYQFTLKVTLKSIPSVKSIRTFSDGAEVLDHIIANKDEFEALPDIIFLDINMPVMDGFQFMDEFIDLLPGLKKEIKVYLVSSSIDPKDMKKAQRIEAISDYLVKPLKSEDINDIILQMS